MDKIRKKALELSLAVYRITELFPKNEILRNRIREKSLDVAGEVLNLINSGFNPHFEKLNADFEVLFAYFEIAQLQKWVNPRNFEILRQHYQDLKEGIENMRGSPQFLGRFSSSWKAQKEELYNRDKEGSADTATRTARMARTVKSQELTPRQKDIFNYLKSNGRIKVGDISHIFSAISKRTIRRDLENLLKMGYIKRSGSGAAVAYESAKKEALDVQRT